MKMILKFDDNNEDDMHSFKVCMKARGMYVALFELQHNLWRKWKHETLTDEQYEMKEEVLQEVYRIIDESMEDSDF